MSAPNDTFVYNSTDDLVIPADHVADAMLHNMRESQRAALYERLRSFRSLPREQWVDHGALAMRGPFAGSYGIPYGDDWLVFVTPQRDGRFRIDDFGSMTRLKQFQEDAENGEDE
jgi:hypothetical protein